MNAPNVRSPLAATPLQRKYSNEDGIGFERRSPHRGARTYTAILMLERELRASHWHARVIESRTWRTNSHRANWPNAWREPSRLPTRLANGTLPPGPPGYCCAPGTCCHGETRLRIRRLATDADERLIEPRAAARATPFAPERMPGRAATPQALVERARDGTSREAVIGKTPMRTPTHIANGWIHRA